MSNHEVRQIDDRQKIEAAEAGLQEVMKNFRQSVHAWSDAEFARPRTVSLAVRHSSWRLAAGWAMGCVLVLGSLSAGLLVNHRHEIREPVARQAAAQPTQQPQPSAQKAATPAQPPAAVPDDDARLMAAVDRDVSREVPSAMEPLAQLMDEGANQ